MQPSIDATSAVPPFEQLRRQYAEAIRDGSLVTGSRLPTVRALAEQLGLATNTVARAVKELEAAGLVETRGRAGTVVAYSPETELRGAQQAAADYVAAVAQLGIGARDALQLVRDALQAAETRDS